VVSFGFFSRPEITRGLSLIRTGLPSRRLVPGADPSSDVPEMTKDQLFLIGQLLTVRVLHVGLIARVIELRVLNGINFFFIDSHSYHPVTGTNNPDGSVGMVSVSDILKALLIACCRLTSAA